jgi:hypothetical protein
MHKVGSKKSIVSLFTFLLLLSASGSGNGLVLCWGHDSHMHIEVTFNGVDCGHFPLAPVKADNHQYRSMDDLLSTAPCYSCTDVPLAFPHHSLKQNGYSTNAHNGKTAITTLTLPPSSFPLIPHTLYPDGHLKVPMKGHAALSQILSSSLRI